MFSRLISTSLASLQPKLSPLNRVQWLSSVAKKSVENPSIVQSNKTIKGSSEKVIIAKKTNINQSPLKIKFLCSLVRDAWMPDAIAQMKFSPKPRAGDVMKILKRACALAKLNHGAIPEELSVKEVVVNKGRLVKRVRIMGRGRSGVSRKRSAHITVKVAQIDFARKLAEAETASQRKKWQKIADLVKQLKDKQAAAPVVESAVTTAS
eukprot:gene22252-27213_t